MPSEDLPEASRLKADLARVEAKMNVPFGRFLDDSVLRRLRISQNRSILALEMKRYFQDLDWRIRFVKAAADRLPDATMKLFSDDKAMRTAHGWRLRRLLDGGVVAVSVMKTEDVKEWRIVGLRAFLPVGKELQRHEADLESLLRCFLRHASGGVFPAKTIGAFQLRTGPGGYAIYLNAHAHFAAQG